MNCHTLQHSGSVYAWKTVMPGTVIGVGATDVWDRVWRVFTPTALLLIIYGMLYRAGYIVSGPETYLALARENASASCHDFYKNPRSYRMHT